MKNVNEFLIVWHFHSCRLVQLGVPVNGFDVKIFMKFEIFLVTAVDIRGLCFEMHIIHVDLHLIEHKKCRNPKRKNLYIFIYFYIDVATKGRLLEYSVYWHWFGWIMLFEWNTSIFWMPVSNMRVKNWCIIADMYEGHSVYLSLVVFYILMHSCCFT